MYLFIILKKCFIHNKGDILKIRQHWLGHRNYNHTKSSSRIFSLRLCLMHWHFAEVYVITSLHMAIKIVIDLPWILNKSKMYKSITKELSLSPNILEFSLIICDECPLLLAYASLCLDIFNIYINGYIICEQQFSTIFMRVISVIDLYLNLLLMCWCDSFRRVLSVSAQGILSDCSKKRVS